MASVRQQQYTGSEINYTLAPGDVLLQCPYDKVHMILKPRFPFHLAKCRSNYKKAMAKKGQQVDMAVCQWNVTHHFPKMEIQYHEQTCPDAGIMVDHMVKLEDATGFKFNAVVNHDLKEEDEEDKKINFDDGEDWESEICSGNGPRGYDPTLKLKKEQGRIIQSLPGVSTRSEREKFREEQAEIFYQRGDFGEAPFHTIDNERPGPSRTSIGRSFNSSRNSETTRQIGSMQDRLRQMDL